MLAMQIQSDFSIQQYGTGLLVQEMAESAAAVLSHGFECITLRVTNYQTNLVQLDSSTSSQGGNSDERVKKNLLQISMKYSTSTKPERICRSRPNFQSSRHKKWEEKLE